MSVQFTSNRTTVATCSSGYIVVGVYDDKDFTLSAQQTDKLTDGALAQVVAHGDLKKDPGSCVCLNSVSALKAKRVLLVRYGPRKKFDTAAFKKTIDGVAGALKSATADSVTYFLDDLELADRDISWIARRLVETLGQAFYKFDQMKKSSKKRRKSWKVQISAQNSSDLNHLRQGIKIGKAVNEGVSLARDLGNLPGNVCTPTYLADTAKKLETHENLTVDVLEEEQMSELGMGALLSVSRGSREPAKLILMHYRGAKDNSQPIALVGKGLTFDAGGISIKPAGAMDEMKFDMCGGAGVIGAMHTIAALKLPVNVIGAVASSENLPDGAANKPGDIVTSMAGITIEVLNTDAEGRLILCDTLTYIDKYKPSVVIDAATLTGACVIALGKHPSGLFSNNDELKNQLVEAGQISEDKVWPMPVWDEYQSQLDSNFADVANIGGRDAGAVTAACFLSRFTKKYRWAHLDIAGTAWHSGKQKGATGRPVPLLVQFVLSHCN